MSGGILIQRPKLFNFYPPTQKEMKVENGSNTKVDLDPKHIESSTVIPSGSHLLMSWRPNLDISDNVCSFRP
jgi:hypothetical protein